MKKFNNRFKVAIFSLMLIGCSSNFTNHTKEYKTIVFYKNNYPFLEGNFDITRDKDFQLYISKLFPEYVKKFNQLYGYKNLKFDFDFKNYDEIAFSYYFKDIISFTKNGKSILNTYNRDFSNFLTNNSININKLHPLEKKALANISSKQFSPLTDEEKKTVAEMVMLHEMGHMYFQEKHSPQYSNLLDLLVLEEEKDEQGRFYVGDMKDEIFADLFALSHLQKKYNNSDFFKNFVKKIAYARTTKKIIYAINNDAAGYNFYSLYKDVNNIPYSIDIKQLNNNVERLVLENLKIFGLGYKPNTTKEKLFKFNSEQIKNRFQKTINSSYKYKRLNFNHFPDKFKNYSSLPEEVITEEMIKTNRVLENNQIRYD